MDSVIKLLAGFEESAYKILMLVIIIPKTLLKIIFDPIGTRKYVDEQLKLIEGNKKLDESQRTPPFTQYLSPVLLLLTLALVPALLLAFLPETGVTITPSAVPDSSTQYIFTGEAAFPSSARGKGYQFKWEVQNQGDPSVVAVEIHTEADPGRGGIKHDDTKATATDTYTYDFNKEGNYRVIVSVMDQYGSVLFTDTKPVSVTPDSKDQTKLKAIVPNSEIESGIQQNALTLDSFSDVLKKDSTIFLAFALLLPPLFFAFIYSLATRKQINEQDMRKVFYVECYYFSPLSLTIWAFYYSFFFLTEGTLQFTVDFWHFVPPILALIWFVSVETNALADESEEDNITRLNAFFIVVACIIAMAVIGLVISVSIADAGVRDAVQKIIIWIYVLISFVLIGIYFINWRKALKKAVAETKTVAKDQQTKISPRLKWIGWSSLSIILCCIASFVYITALSFQATGTSSEATPAITTTPSSGEYREEFNQNNDDWKLSVIDGVAEDATANLGSDGGVLITFKPQSDQKPSAYYIYNANAKYSNVQIETTAKSNNDNPHTISLICRYNETEGWYEFEVSESGDYYIYQVNVADNNTEYIVLTSGNSPVVQVGGENTYTATCSDNNLSLSINNTPVEPVQDPASKFMQGKVGVSVYSPESQEVHVQFSYVTITELREQPNLANVGATETPTPVPSISVTEQFDPEISHWDVSGDREQINVDTANNTLHIQLSEKDGQIPFVYLINNVSSYSDVQMEVTVTNKNVNDTDGIDLICRLNGNGWYDFEVSSAGSYTIYAYDSIGGKSTLASGSSDKIKTGQASNTYTAKCVGNELTLLVNGETVTTFQETTFNYAEGSIGFGVFSWDGSPVDVSVDSVIITGTALQPSIQDAVTDTTSTPGANATEPPTEASATDSPAQEARQFFTEEFDTSDNWTSFVVDGNANLITNEDNPGLSIFTENSLLTFDLNAKDLWVYETYDLFEYDNVRIDASVINRGVNTNNVSLICRYTKTGWYEFNIANNGLYWIYVAEVDSDGYVNYKEIYGGGSTAIKSGNGTNEYTAICNGNTLALYINGDETRVITETFYNLISGKIGVSVSSFDIFPVAIDIDWVKISEP